MDHPHWSLAWEAGPAKDRPARIYIGSEKAAKSRTWMTKFNITRVVNCTLGCPNKFGDKEYTRLAISDDINENLLGKLSRGIRFVEDSHGANVLIHCSKGISRSVSVFIGWLMKMEKLTLRQSFFYVQAKRSVADPNSNFMRQLMTFELNLFNQPSLTPDDLLPCPFCLKICFEFALLACNHRCCIHCFKKLPKNATCSHCSYEEKLLKHNNSVEDLSDFLHTMCPNFEEIKKIE